MSETHPAALAAASSADTAPAPHTADLRSGPINPHHWHVHITTFWVLVLIGVLLLVATVVLTWCYAFPGYTYARWPGRALGSNITWAPFPVTRKRRPRVRFAQRGSAGGVNE